MSRETHNGVTTMACPIMSDGERIRNCLGVQCMAWVHDPKDDSAQAWGHCHLTQPTPND